MSEPIRDPEEAARKARALMEADVERRVESVRVLARAANDADTTEEAAATARSVHERAWQEALATGWSDKELRATGARPPGKPATRRARTVRRSESAATPVG